AFSGDQPVGLVNCFVGFSTFRAKPLINVHDLCVHHQYRGQGVGRRLLSAVAQHAQDHGFCRVTLEVRSDNEIARGLYHSMKFQPGTPPGVTMEFLTKSISEAES
ncbi:MAG: GNAT family N-acetyltransferase, partial [Planctomycetota bacterium]|nr:GNAT family N-acetyltransferase [Planctomycetota bacterium]